MTLDEQTPAAQTRHEPIVMDRALARVVDGALVADVAAFVAGLSTLDPGGGACRVAVADGWAAHTGPGLFANRVQGSGLGASGGDVAAVADDGTLAAVEAFYAGYGLPAELELCPLADPSWWQVAAGRGYRLASFRNVYVRTTDDPEPVTAPPGPGPAIEVAVVGPGGADEVGDDEVGRWSQVVLDGFGYRPGPQRDRVAHWNTMMAGLDEAVLLLARIDGEPVGASNLLVHGEVASLGGTATLAARRRLGVQRALLTARLAEARARGCRLAVVTADPGGASARNIERHGFRLAYTNTRLRRDTTGPA